MEPSADGQELNWNYDKAFREMTTRRLNRRGGGYFEKPPLYVRILKWGVIIGFLLAGIAYASYRGAFVGIIILLAFMSLGLFINRIVAEFRIIVLWLYVAWLVMFAATGNIIGLFVATGTNWVWRVVVWTLTGVFIAASVAIHFLMYRWYPARVRDSYIPRSYFGISRGRFPNEGIYLSRPLRMWERLGLTRKRRFSYAGGLDDEGRPHGMGHWEELATSGESLEGWWRHGVPVGPFRSSEQGSGYAFQGVRVGYVLNRLDESWEKSAFWPKRYEHAQGYLRYGVASVECSVSGKFFRHLPEVVPAITGADPHALPHAQGCAFLLRNLVTPADHLLSKQQNSLEMTYDAATDQVRVEHGFVHPNRDASGMRTVTVCVTRDLNSRVPFADAASGAASSSSMPAHQFASMPPKSGAIGTVRRPLETFSASLESGAGAGGPAGSGGGGSGVPTAKNGVGPANTAANNGDSAPAGTQGAAAVSTAPPAGASSGGGGAASGSGQGGSSGVGVDDLVDLQHQLGDLTSLMLNMFGETHPLEVEGLGADVGEVYGPEVLIFIHGFNCGTGPSLKVLAQLLTLGDFPPFIRPLVFSWPAGSVITYHWARDDGAQSAATRRDFRTMLEGLRDAGIRKIHIMAHSMGARVLMNACEAFEGILARAQEPAQPQLDATGSTVQPQNSAAFAGNAPAPPTPTNSLALLRLETVTMLSPDYELESFTRLNGGYDTLRKYCRLVSIYGDSNDEALLAAFIFNGFKRSLGRSVYDIVRPEPKPGIAAAFGSALRVGATSSGGGSAVAAAAAAALPEADIENQMPPPADTETAAGSGAAGVPAANARVAAENELRNFTKEGIAQLEDADSAMATDHTLALPEEPLLGERADADGTRQLAARKLIDLCNHHLLAVPPDVGLDDIRVVRSVGAEQTAKVASVARAAAASKKAGGRGRMRWNRHQEEADNPDGANHAPAQRLYLDLDCMDTTLLEHNIHTVRHSFFNLNSALVEDIRELLVHKRPAFARANTQYKEGNVYVFRIAPSIVKNP